VFAEELQNTNALPSAVDNPAKITSTNATATSPLVCCVVTESIDRFVVSQSSFGSLFFRADRWGARIFASQFNFAVVVVVVVVVVAPRWPWRTLDSSITVADPSSLLLSVRPFVRSSRSSAAKTRGKAAEGFPLLPTSRRRGARRFVVTKTPISVACCVFGVETELECTFMNRMSENCSLT
jgi:hypothetical protein